MSLPAADGLSRDQSDSLSAESDPPPRKMPGQDRWYVTKTEVEKLRYVWSVENVSLRGEGVGQGLESSTFEVGSGSDAKQWRLLLYLRGESQDSKDYISLFMKLLAANDSKVMARAAFSVLSIEGKEKHTKQFTHSFAPGEIRGYRQFIKCDFQDVKDDLTKDRLTVVCEVSCLADGDNYELAGPNKMPECRLSNDMSQLFESQRFSDVTLNVDGHEFRAHKAILGARSPVFAAMFEHKTEESKLSWVTITDVKQEVFRELLRFIYNGRVENLTAVGGGLLAAADKYALDRLKAICEQALCDNLSVENVADALLLAYLHSAQQLKAHAIHCIRLNTAEVMSTPSWCSLLAYPRLLSHVCQALGRSVSALPVQDA